MDQAPTSYSEAMVRLKSRVSSMEDRPQQDTAALAIERAIQDESILICQAGTGVGKSNAALIPAIVSGQRVVYATATKVLQSQIVEKDLPFLAEHLGVPFTYASLKGWSSYLCHARLAEHEDVALRDQLLAEMGDDDTEHVGDRESFSIDFDAKTWGELSIATDDCPGSKTCPFGASCKPQAARDRVAMATVAVVNHSILATDALVQDMTAGGFSLVGPRDVLIVDEAHELEEFISGVLGEQFTQGGIRNLASELRAFGRRIGLDGFEDVVGGLGMAADSFFDGLKAGRLRHADVVAHSEPYEQLLGAYIDARNLLLQDEVLAALAKQPDADRRKLRAQRERMAKQCLNKTEALTSLLLADDTALVRFVEENTRMFRGQRTTSKVLRTTPVSVAPWAKATLWPLYETKILISATILVEGKATYVSSRLGVEGFTALDAGTPFDYQRNAMLYIPAHLPEPSGQNKNRWSTMALEETIELVKAAGGGALLLFTSNAQLNNAWDTLRNRLPFECRRQGDESNNRLMEWFRSEHDGVLFATRSFFTGASFEGDTCRLVVIDKLPFPVPTEPVFEARCEEVKRNGGNDFAELTIPMMTLPLQQGFGRLIRTKSDRGVVAILDPRLKTKSYGSKIVKSLPPARVSTSIVDVETFFARVTA